MKRIAFLHLFLFVVCSTVFAQTGEFTYQGKLVAGGSAANTPHDFEFRLCTSEINCPIPLEIKYAMGILVSNGIFTVKLDFGSEHFSGEDRWLEIAVRPAGGSTFTTLTPRQRVTSAPYSIKSLTSVTATNATQLGGVNANQFVVTTDPRMSDPRMPLAGSADYIQANPSVQQPGASLNIEGGGTFGGTVSGNILNATTQFNLNGSRVLGNGGLSTNLFVGVNTGISNTSGGQNSFFGRSVGSNNTTGTGNSFFGLNAGFNNVAGGQNSFFGRGAGSDNISGSFNTMIGSGATTSAGDLSYATAIGAGSLANASNTVVLGRSEDSVQVPGNMNVVGSGIVAGTISGGVVNTFTQFEINGVRVLRMDGNGSSLYGGVSGPVVPIGDLNTFFGMASGLVNTGHRNSFFGNLAGNANEGGAFNSFFGVGTGENNTTGNENTAVGFRARPGSGDLTNATAIGANAQVNQSNSLVLGSIAGVNNATADTKVGIGTTTPTEKLHVAGNAVFTGTITGDGSGLSNLSPSGINGAIQENQLGLAGAIFSGRIDGLATGGNFIQSGGAIAYTTAVTNVNGTNLRIVSPNRTCTATNLYAKTSVPPGDSNERWIVLTVNGSYTSLQCNIIGSSTTCASGARVSIGPGSELWMRLATDDGGTPNDIGGTSIMFGWECR
jgi:hypothetical protein